MKRVLLVLVLCPLLLYPQSPPPQDVLLLHNGDLVLASFGDYSGGQVQLYSLSPRARVDISYSSEQIDTLTFTHANGWITYPGRLDGTTLQIVLRETGGGDSDQTPGDSDVVVRVFNGKVKVQLHADNDRRGETCDRCNARLDW